MSKDILRVEPNERVDLSDFLSLPNAIQDHERQIMSEFATDPARTRHWILSGFAMDNPAAKQIRVTKGKAILGQRFAGVAQYGTLVTEGDATLTVDLNAYGVGVYGVYIRFERVAGEAQSRIFWDPSAGGSEFSQSINTRYTAAWSMRVESTTPGVDWVKLGEVDQATMAITDQREFFFEGDKVGGTAYESGWSSDGGGAANDRNADRATYGVSDLQMFTAAMRQSLEHIKGRGLRRWWERDIGGMNLGFDAAPVEDRLAIYDANFWLGISGSDPRLTLDSTDYLSYARATNVMSLWIGGTDIYVWNATEFYPFAGSTNKLGRTAEPWSEIWGDLGELTDRLNIRNNGASQIMLQDTGGAGDQKNWFVGAYATTFQIMAVTDGFAVSTIPFSITRSGEICVIMTLETTGIGGTIDLISADGRLGLGGANTGVADIEVFNDLIPTGAFNLGAVGSQWDNLWVDKLHVATSVNTSLIPDTDAANALGSATLGWSGLFLRGTDPDIEWRASGGGVDDKWWRLEAGATGLTWWGVNDARDASINLMQLTRSGVAAGTARLNVQGRISGFQADLDIDSGAAPYDFALTAKGINPAMLFDEDDASVDIEGRYWTVRLENPVADKGSMVWACWDNALTSRYEWLRASNQGGAANQYQVEAIKLAALTVIEMASTLGISADPGAPGAGIDVGLCDVYYTGAAGAPFSILGVSGLTARDSTGFIKVYVNQTPRYIPFFDNYNG